MKLLVSACLVGCPCRYDGRAFENEILKALVRKGLAVAVCPEILGGLSIPRPKAEIVGGTGDDVLSGHAKILNEWGKDVTPHFLIGAFKVLDIALREGTRYAVFKDKSPSCGVYHIYDGSFTGKICEGSGVTTAILRKYSISLFSNEQIR
ncbi:MAG: DUF523 domain-containing protein [Acetomicrobium sp.]